MRPPDTLPARLYLLAYDRDRGRLSGPTWLGYAVRAAALADLWAGGHIVDRAGRADVPPGARPPADPILGAVWTEVADTARRWDVLIRRNRRGTENAVLAQLDAAGTIRIVRERTRWRSARIDLRDPLAASRLNDRVAVLVRGAQPVSRWTPTDAALIGLLAAADMRTAISRPQRREYAARIDAATRAGGPAIPALKRAIAHVKSSMS